MESSTVIVTGATATKIKQIHHPKGDIYHALKATDDDYTQFGEAYFTTIHYGDTKGWKQHTRMTMNLVVPVGKVALHFFNEETHESASFIVGEERYYRVTVAPGVWMAFEGLSDGLNLMLNVASIPHDPTEAINVDLETYPLQRVAS